MNFDGTTDDALGQRVVVFKIVHHVLRVICRAHVSALVTVRRLLSCIASSSAVGRCVRHRGHRDTEDTEEFRDFASTTLPSFFFNDTAPTEIYTLSLHDALPI